MGNSAYTILGKLLEDRTRLSHVESESVKLFMLGLNNISNLAIHKEDEEILNTLEYMGVVEKTVYVSVNLPHGLTSLLGINPFGFSEGDYFPSADFDSVFVGKSYDDNFHKIILECKEDSIEKLKQYFGELNVKIEKR